MLLNAAPAEPLGFSSSRLRRLSDMARGYVDKGVFPGVSVVVARHGQVVFAEHHGLRDIAAARPMTADTIVRIYSMTKPVTSVAMMMLYEEGRFNLYDPVSRYIPAFTGFDVLLDRGGYTDLDREPTIRDLFTHTAGLAYGMGDTPLDRRYVEAGLWNMDPEPTLEEWLARLTSVKLLDYQPGERWQYSCATDVLGCLVQRFSDQPFDVFLQERIFGPLGMVDTGFYVPEAKADRFARLYSPAPGGGFQESPSPLNLLCYDKPHPMMSGGAGLVSTAADYLRFALALANGGAWEGVRLLGRKTLELMTLNHLAPALLPYRAAPTTFDGYGFGLGFAVLMDLAAAQTPGSVGCFGWSGAASTDFWVDPREDLVALLMTQVIPQPYGPINRELRAMVYQALVG